MSILQGVRAVNLKRADKARFIIKPRSSAKQNIESPSERQNHACDRDVEQFIAYMIGRSMRLRQMLQKKSINEQEEFFKKHLFGSTCVRTILKVTLDKMLSDRRLGKNLKGMNKSNLQQIQNSIWSSLQRETSLYLNQKTYKQQKQKLTADLQRRKQEIEEEIIRIQSAESSQPNDPEEIIYQKESSMQEEFQGVEI